MTNKRFLLVAGFDYLKEGLDFRVICTRRMKRLLKTFPDATFLIYDVGRGEVFISEQPPTPPKKKKKPNRSESTDTTTFKPVTRKNYSGADPEHPNRFDKNPKGIMSITDIYKAITDIGADNEKKGTLAEFSIFSHGWYGGAILVNSNDTSPTNKRAPDDKDTRSFDFLSENFTTNELKHFKAAFSEGGFSHLWGCSFTEAYHQVLYQVLKSSKYRKAKPGSLNDSDNFDFDFTEEQAKDFFDADKNFFPQPKEVTVTENKTKVTKLKFELEFTRSLKQIKVFLKSGMKDTYAQKLATASGHPCYSAYPGTYADLEENDKNAILPLMLIPRRKPPYNDDFTRYIDFYKTYLRIGEDQESRGYATFTP